ncbi:MAG TPA: fibronectin type III domain-containing protein, partial [Acidimicrobiia bacterium]|nr:fibronectin type III domain-containing protein [Acidimicrobiia bacterium]
MRNAVTFVETFCTTHELKREPDSDSPGGGADANHAIRLGLIREERVLVRGRRTRYVLVASIVLAAAVGAAPAGAATTLPSAPRTPTAAPGNARATISWVKPLYDRGLPITSYLVTGKNVATGALTTPVTSTSTSVTVTGLQNGTTYGFKIAARNSTGTGPTSVQVNVKAGLPAVVPSVTAALEGMSARVSWSAPAANAAPINGYRVTPYRDGKAAAAKMFASTATQQTMT